MVIAAGTRLGPYEVIAPLGAGGMGEVWSARDTRLERSVAIKVLPANFAEDAQLRLRFEREAKTISQLNHPHICTLYDVGDNYLVMELLDGETLADRLRKGPLPLDLIVRYGVQIAEALEKAHRAGVVHRDLKPGNIMITKSGAKLLDFGLAKPTDGGVVAALTSVRTEQKNLTEEGAIVGTFQYMAPEQLEGGDVDARTDIFALGAVLYEMATGRHAFEGRSKASLIASILTVDPQPISAVQPMTPAALDRIVRMCLRKEPDERWQSAHDIAAELRWLSEPQHVAAAMAPMRRPYIAWAAAALFALAALTAGYMLQRERNLRLNQQIVRTTIVPPEKMEFDFAAYGAPPALSPDGQKIVFGAIAPGQHRTLWVRSLDSLTPRQLSGTEDAMFPFWSPDGKEIAYFDQDTLNKIDVDGGAPIRICSVNDGRGGSWSPDGQTIIFATRYSPIYRVPAAGGTPAEITTLANNEMTHRWAQFLPDGHHFLFLASTTGSESSDNALCAGSLEGKFRKTIMASAYGATYADGAIIFSRDGVLTAQAFDTRTLQLTGDPAPLHEQHIQASPLLSLAIASIDRGDTLVYQPGVAARATQLKWLDRSGKDGGTLGESATYTGIVISPDGKSAIASYAPPSNLWLFDLTSGTRTRMTFGKSREASPTWSPDGRKFAYMITEPGHYRLHVKDLVSGTDEEVAKGEATGLPSVTSWSPDGDKLLCIIGGRTTRADILWFSFADRKMHPFLITPAIESNARFSPDGKWVAYQSSESGSGEVYVAPFPPTGAKWQVSSGGANANVPRWRADGKEIFYVQNPSPAMIAVPVTLGATPMFGKPVNLFSFVVPNPTPNLYDVTRDGQRFLINTRVGEEPPPEPLVVVQHFGNEVRAALTHHQ